MRKQKIDSGNIDFHHLSDGGRLWTVPLLENIGASVETFSGMRVLILGAGQNALGEYLAELGACIVSVDIERNPNWIMVDGCWCIAATNECLPFRDSTFDIIISCSTFQYVEHDAVFSEIFRVGKNSSIVLLHENMPFNPIVLTYRAFRWFKSLGNRHLRSYVKSIKRYLAPSDLPLNYFTVERLQRYYLIGALNHLLGDEYYKEIALMKAGNAIESIDKFILNTFPFFGALCWFCVYRLRINKSPWSPEGQVLQSNKFPCAKLED